MGWKQSSLKLEGERGTMVLTPELSRKTRTNVKDLESLVKAHGEKLDLDLYFTMSIVQKGVKFSWGPESDLNLEEMEEVLETLA